MFRGERIKDILLEKRMTITGLARIVGMTKTGMNGVISGSNVRAGNLEKIADVFQLPIDYFFDRKVEIIYQKGEETIEALPEADVISLQREVEFLKKMISEKERFIQYLLAHNEKKLAQKNDDNE